MPVAPLFVASMAALKLALRLDGAKTAGAAAVIDQAVEDVRIKLYQRLGATRTAALVATAYAQNPTTDAGVLRSLCNTVETKWVKLFLLRALPTLFLDGSGVKQQVWNDEAPFATRTSDLEREIKRLEAEIEEALSALQADADEDAGNGVQAATIEPEELPDRPGATVWAHLRGENLEAAEEDE